MKTRFFLQFLIMDVDEAQTQTDFSLLSSARPDFVQFVAKNELIFKSCLLIDLIRSEVDPVVFYKSGLALLQDKIVARIIGICVYDQTDWRDEQLDRKICAYLLVEYRDRVDPSFCLTEFDRIQTRIDLSELMDQISAKQYCDVEVTFKPL